MDPDTSDWPTQQGRGGGGGGSGGARDGGGDYGRLTQTIGANIQKITQNVSTIQRLVNQLGTPQDSDQLRGRLHDVQHSTNTLAKDTGKLLRDLADLPAPANPSEQRQHKLQRDRLTNDFSVVLNNLQSAQRQAANKEKESVLRARASSGIGGNPFEDDGSDAFGSGGGAAPRPPQLQMEQEVDLQAIQEREQAIRQLESDILDVNQIFKDLAVMVHEQGEIVDSIEANVEAATVHVEQGHQQIQQAARYKSSLRKKRVFCVVLLVIVVIVVAVIIYVAVKNN